MKATLIATRQFDAIIGQLLTVDEVAELEFDLASNPEAHPVIPGTGGVRKMRWARSGKGKRGGIRVIYYFISRARVVCLIAAYAKSTKENLTDGDKKAIRALTQWFEETLP